MQTCRNAFLLRLILVAGRRVVTMMVRVRLNIGLVPRHTPPLSLAHVRMRIHNAHCHTTPGCGPLAHGYTGICNEPFLASQSDFEQRRRRFEFYICYPGSVIRKRPQMGLELLNV